MTVVRFACEAAALASWLSGACDERLIDAAEAADRDDWDTCARLCSASWLVAKARAHTQAHGAAYRTAFRAFLVAHVSGAGAGATGAEAARSYAAGCSTAASDACGEAARALFLGTSEWDEASDAVYTAASTIGSTQCRGRAVELGVYL